MRLFSIVHVCINYSIGCMYVLVDFFLYVYEVSCSGAGVCGMSVYMSNNVAEIEVTVFE